MKERGEANPASERREGGAMTGKGTTIITTGRCLKSPTDIIIEVYIYWSTRSGGKNDLLVRMFGVLLSLFFSFFFPGLGFSTATDERIREMAHGGLFVVTYCTLSIGMIKQKSRSSIFRACVRVLSPSTAAMVRICREETLSTFGHASVTPHPWWHTCIFFFFFLLCPGLPPLCQPPRENSPEESRRKRRR